MAIVAGATRSRTAGGLSLCATGLFSVGIEKKKISQDEGKNRNYKNVETDIGRYWS